MYDLLIQGAEVLQITGADATTLPAHDIAVSAGRIAAIAPGISPGLAHALIPAEGMLAMPGMVNCHAHSAMGLFRGVAEDVGAAEWFNGYIWPMETNLTEDDIYWGALLGLAEMIEAGVTAVADHYFAMDRVGQAVEQAGVRALLAWAVFSGPDQDQRLRDTLGFVERWHGAADGRIRACLGPHSPYTCTPAFLAQVARAAAERGTGIHIHLSETADQVAQSRAAHGKTPVAVARDAGLFAVPALAAHVGHPDPDDIAILAAHGVAVGCCPKTEMKMGIGVTPAVDLRRAGVVVGIGSDGAASNNTYDILESARLLALLEKHTRRDPQVLPLPEVIALATSEGARALGLADVTGALRPGLAADLVLLRRDGPHTRPIHNPLAALAYSAQSADVDTVIVAGRVLMRERRLLTIDKARVLHEVAARATRLTARGHGQQMAVYPEAQ